jgi:hypothetical protein
MPRPKLNILAPNPEGFCQCGCGVVTPIARKTNAARNTVAGEHVRFISSHTSRSYEYTAPELNPSGKCQCGCEESTPLAKCTDKRSGTVRGKPTRFVPGHAPRKSPYEYIEEDRGYITPCWIWQRGKSSKGYGTAPKKVGEKATSAHRRYYEQENGAIPDGLVVDHLCRVHECVNPSHLEAVSQAENVARGTRGVLRSRS